MFVFWVFVFVRGLFFGLCLVWFLGVLLYTYGWFNGVFSHWFVCVCETTSRGWGHELSGSLSNGEFLLFLSVQPIIRELFAVRIVGSVCRR